MFKTSNIIADLLLTSVLLAVAGNVMAQNSRGGTDYDNGDAYVVIYEHCEFRGERREISVGEYRRMHDLDFANDSVSSIRVPRGYEVTVYEDDDFRGTYARVTRDIVCFDKQWNDTVSSIRVHSDGRRYGGRDDGGYDRYNEDRRYDDRYNDHDEEVTTKNISRVVFENRVLQQTSKRQWQIADARYGVSQYKEQSRDQNSVYLQNSYTAEKVRIDLYANDVTFVDRNGRVKRYAIQRKQAALKRPTLGTKPTTSHNNKSNHGSNTIIRGGCFNYKAYTRGGTGGVRFHGHEGFNQFGKKAHTGRLCHDGELTLEINKKQAATDVIVEIKDRRYRFAPNEKATAYKNTWYRKHVTLQVKPF